jgi:hypothetical protein
MGCVTINNSYRFIVAKLLGKRSVGRPRSTMQNMQNMKMDLSEVGYADRMWMEYPQDHILLV